MDIVEIVFSPTGGTQKVAEGLIQTWGAPSRRIDLTAPSLDMDALTVLADEVAVIAVPSFGGRVPALAAQRLAKVQGNESRCILVCVYGNRAYEDTLVELHDLACQAGFQPIAAVAAIAEHAIMHQYASGRPDQEDRKVLNGFAREIGEKLSRSGDPVGLSLPGNRPYKKMGNVGLVPKGSNQCTQCGLCAETCPAQAISKELLKQTDGKRCISCMRCVVNCPQSARKVNGALVATAALAMKKVCSVRKDNELFL